MQQPIFKTLTAFFTLLAFILTGCFREESSSVNQDKIYCDYEVLYDKNTDKTSVFARFKFGNATGTLLELDSTSNVKFNGDILPYDVIRSAHFKEYAGKVSAGTFTYTNLNNDVFINKAADFEPVAFPAFGPLSKSTAFTFAWDGTALKPKQSINLWLSATNNPFDGQLFVQAAENATNLVLGIDQLSKLNTAEANCAMEHWTTDVPAEVPAAGGLIVVKYKAQNTKVAVTN